MPLLQVKLTVTVLPVLVAELDELLATLLLELLDELEEVLLLEELAAAPLKLYTKLASLKVMV